MAQEALQKAGIDPQDRRRFASFPAGAAAARSWVTFAVKGGIIGTVDGRSALPVACSTARPVPSTASRALADMGRGCREQRRSQGCDANLANGLPPIIGVSGGVAHRGARNGAQRRRRRAGPSRTSSRANIRGQALRRVNGHAEERRARSLLVHRTIWLCSRARGVSVRHRPRSAQGGNKTAHTGAACQLALKTPWRPARLHRPP